MKYKALVSFAGEISAFTGEVLEIKDEKAKDLLECGYIKKAAEVEPKRTRTKST